MKSFLKNILLILLAVGFIFLLTFFFLKETLFPKDFFSQKNIQQIESLVSEEKDFPKKEFITPDEKLKFVYPSNWVEATDTKNFQEGIPKEAREKYKFKNLFLASRIKNDIFYGLTVTEGFFDLKNTPQEIIDIMKEINDKEGITTEIIEIETKEKEAFFRALYAKKSSPNNIFYSKEKILLVDYDQNNKKAYFISFVFSRENKNEKIEKEINEILESIQLIK
ncbi:MAG: hypothetical protein NTU58_02860 [Candidatus Nealsonbacteria bacterium]|nr:hypothetical protein [Candidatus Nealsonbacteria bacterium]